MTINPVTITLSKHEAERVWFAVDRRIKTLAENGRERKILERASDKVGAAVRKAALGPAGSKR